MYGILAAQSNKNVVFKHLSMKRKERIKISRKMQAGCFICYEKLIINAKKKKLVRGAKPPPPKKNKY
jgi:hypothetical protein